MLATRKIKDYPDQFLVLQVENIVERILTFHLKENLPLKTNNTEVALNMGQL